MMRVSRCAGQTIRFISFYTFPNRKRYFGSLMAHAMPVDSGDALSVGGRRFHLPNRFFSVVHLI
jgi:hypothetical protein